MASQLRDWMHTATLLATSTADAIGGYDFFLAHVLTVGHALRILLPHIPEEHRIKTMKQYALFTILVYLAQLRPSFSSDNSASVSVVDVSWDEIYSKTLESRWYKDVHWPKVVRALREVEQLRGPEDGVYKNAAMEFLAEFDGWTGFGSGVDDIN